MASRFMPTLRDLAMEPDEDRRLEMAAEIDRDAADLDEKWGRKCSLPIRQAADCV